MKKLFLLFAVATMSLSADEAGNEMEEAGNEIEAEANEAEQEMEEEMNEDDNM